ncbi:hypothetical protein BSKO_02332 [Bryopsis sp. KO-2023]|nr:hypothetical protein BSKO_02332 [Bryopsis sp. KO-2023]
MHSWFSFPRCFFQLSAADVASPPRLKFYTPIWRRICVGESSHEHFAVSSQSDCNLRKGPAFFDKEMVESLNPEEHAPEQLHKGPGRTPLTNLFLKNALGENQADKTEGLPPAVHPIQKTNHTTLNGTMKTKATVETRNRKGTNQDRHGGETMIGIRETGEILVSHGGGMEGISVGVGRVPVSHGKAQGGGVKIDQTDLARRGRIARAEGQGRSDWGDNRRGGSWSNDENEEQSFKLREQIVGELIYGVSPVTGALKAWRRQVHKLYVQEGLQPKKRKEAHAVDDAISKAGALGVGVEYVTKHDLNMVVDNRPHQGLALDCSPLEYVPLLELPRASTYAGSKPPVWLALDEVKDPQNLGAIIRSAYFLGTTGIIVSAKNSASLSAAVSKVSAGVMEFFPVHSCVKMQQFLVEAQERGWLVVGAAASPDATPCGEFRPTKPVVLVVGNEGYGLRTTVKQACEAFVKIESAAPEANKEFQLDSLNVSVATGILLHSLIVAAKQAPVESS